VATDAATAASAAVRGRARRQREEELLVWPDLVFIEFISAVLFTLTFTLLSIAINAPLQDRANPANTPNPSKAPWYFLNLQELLLHMDPALAGVIVPTVALIAIGAIPFYDRSPEGQGQWLTTPGAWRMVWLGSIVGTVGTTILILWDGAKHVQIYENIVGKRVVTDEATGAFVGGWPKSLEWFRSSRALQEFINDNLIPEGLRVIPIGKYLMRTDLLGLTAEPIPMDVNVAGFIQAQIIPVTFMVGLPILLSIVAWRIGWAKTRRDHMILQFSGFIAVYFLLTIVGTAFRGRGMELYWPWDNPPVIT
jgi:menaquinol-cytochrome c reductase cytochrome b/c subunit